MNLLERIMSWRKKEGLVIDSVNPIKIPVFERDELKTITQAFNVRVGKQPTLNFRNWTSFHVGEDPEYSLSEPSKLEDVESYVRQATSKKVALATKAGYSFVGKNKRTVKYIELRMKQIAALSGKPFGIFIREALKCFIRDHNAFIVLARDTEQSGGIRHRLRNLQKNPIAGLFLAHPSTMFPKMDKDGAQIIKWIQETPDGKRKEFQPEDVIHLYFDREPGFLFGKPIFVPVYDDIRALRRIEENAEVIIYKHAYPLIQYIVGTEEKPATTLPDGRSEINVVKTDIENMPPEAIFVTPERHRLEVFGAKNFTIDLTPHLEHFKKRVFSGISVSSVDMGEGECYDAITETLTENGWKTHDLIDHTKEKIATFNPETNKVEFHLAAYKHESDYVGDLIKFNGKHLDIAVTPHHEMWVCSKTNLKKGSGSEWQKIHAIDLLEGRYPSEFYMREAAEWEEVDQNLEGFSLEAESAIRGRRPKPINCDLVDFAQFLGYFISEGCLDRFNAKEGRYRVLLSQNPGYILEQMENVLDKMNIAYSSQNHDDRESTIRVYGKTLYKWLERNIPHGAQNKRIPKEVFTWPKEARIALFKALIEGDGTDGKLENQKTYYTTSSKLADDVQMLALSLGFRAKKKFCKQAELSWGSEIYRVLVSDGGSHCGFRLIQPQMISKKHYEGKIYCYNVPNHLFITRRNGYVTIQGNTANRSTADNMSRALVDCVKDYQKAFSEFMDFCLISELLIESGLGRQNVDVLNEDNMVHFVFEEIDLEMQIKKQNHLTNLYQSNTITESEARIEMGYDPLQESEREQMFLNLVTIPTAEAQAEAKANNAIENANQPENQHGKRSGPRKSKPDSLVSQVNISFNDESSYRAALGSLSMALAKDLKKLEMGLDNQEKIHYICNCPVKSRLSAALKQASRDNFKLTSSSFRAHQLIIRELKDSAQLFLEDFS